MPDAPPSPAGTRPIILLGASNLRQGLRTVLRCLSRRIAAPLHVYAACGFGRSYGLKTWIPFRSLPGITMCGLWEAISREIVLSAGTLRTADNGEMASPSSEHPLVFPSAAPSPQAPPVITSMTGDEASSSPIRHLLPLALITDVGNDLLYGIDVGQILAWVSECLERLQVIRARSVVTLPPIERVRQLSDWRFRATRSLFFPQSRLTRDMMFARIEELSSGLASLAERYSAAVVRPELAWYGFDPIHIRRSRREAAWNTFFDGWPGESSEPDRTVNISRSRPPGFTWIPRAQVVLKGNREKITAQPSYRGPGMDVSLY